MKTHGQRPVDDLIGEMEQLVAIFQPYDHGLDVALLPVIVWEQLPGESQKAYSKRTYQALTERVQDIRLLAQKVLHGFEATKNELLQSGEQHIIEEEEEEGHNTEDADDDFDEEF